MITATAQQSAREAATLPELPGHTEHALFGIVLGWFIGMAVLAGLIVFVLHFSDIGVFLATIRTADPMWLALAAGCQAATYCCAAGVWWCVLRRTGSRRSLFSLLGLALVELFANQAVPTGGLSGSLMVIRGLVRRGIETPVAMTALLVAALSYYAAYLLVVIIAFILLWYVGDLSQAWLSLLTAFFAVILLLVTAVLLLTRSRGRFVPRTVSNWQPIRRAVKILSDVRIDLLKDGGVIFEAVAFQAAVFLFDAATLWCASLAVGLSLDPSRVFTSFVLASVVATLSPIPLGLGSFEGTSTAMLHLMGGGLEASLAATLILRGLTLWLPMLPGLWLIRREVKATSTERTPD